MAYLIGKAIAVDRKFLTSNLTKHRSIDCLGRSFNACLLDIQVSHPSKKRQSPLTSGDTAVTHFPMAAMLDLKQLSEPHSTITLTSLSLCVVTYFEVFNTNGVSIHHQKCRPESKDIRIQHDVGGRNCVTLVDRKSSDLVVATGSVFHEMSASSGTSLEGFECEMGELRWESFWVCNVRERITSIPWRNDTAVVF